MAAPRRIHLPYILDHQREIIASPARHKVVDCGRRWGKTILGLICCVVGHGPSGILRGALNGAQIRWVAPTYPIASSIWKALKASLWEAWSHKDEVSRTITLPGSGGSVAVRSADNPDSLRGVGSDGVVMDEAAFCSLEAWEEGIRPTLSDRGGWAVFISTPKGYNWFFDLFNAAKLDNTGTWQAWQRPTSDNPLIPTAEIEAARRAMAEFRFRQEYLAEFVAPGVGFFRRENWRFVDAIPDGARRIVRAWDFASTRVKKEGDDPDYTAGVKMSRLFDGRYLIEDVRRTRGTPGDKDRYIRSTTSEDGHAVEIILPIDPGSAGLDVVEHYVKNVLTGQRIQTHKESGDKAWRADPLAGQQQIGNVYLLRAPAWNHFFLNETDMFPEGDHDDLVDAASLAFRRLAGSFGFIPRSAPNDTIDKALAGTQPSNGSDPKAREFLKGIEATDFFR